MIASLPMYDRPEAQAANDALWAAVRDRLGYGPDQLDRTTPFTETWANPDLVLGQICNLPYRARFRGDVILLGCGDHRLDDTPAGYYHSVFVVRKDDAARGLAPAVLGTFAYNDALSQSGWGAPVTRIAAQGLQFKSTLETGSHLASLRAVAEGRADLAAIDAVTWAQQLTWEPQARDLAVIGRTGLSPAQTFVTAKGRDPVPIRAALADAIDTLDAAHKDALRLYGFVTLPASAYDSPVPIAPKTPLHLAAI
ncbi:phosphate/phosphite/phosphonate ABC transporter substrate-binding protein [Pseudooctadecabacter sp.]|uniref:phosphate/phosphite/phosphonate ABC transporter substrate-binding protein n=1 Tax=Pseudooctadecabacter sp. TaxID=1966338 RepID=UPI0025EB48B4|nr:PhnD/SsuA/transferrin family substrate-binding protein [Pseudooctadecabacter sp.]